ncbi:GGDEF domain-containing protein [Micromonospora sp. NPDC000207]|uniref:GGDEF domain-containing protein n=1 Tax=Micromonospora sp. NPDC000207 TaxID=3154246 RepID=UPI00331B2104
MIAVDLAQRIAALEADVARWRRLATTDPLTGVLNRLGLAERFADLDDHRRSLAVVDLDGFKEINDWYDHSVGDQVLIAVAAEMCHLGAVARLGGDEFAVIGRDLPPAGPAWSWQMVLPGGPTTITGSAGVVEVDPADLPGTLHRADQAMYRVKRGGLPGEASGRRRVRDAVPVGGKGGTGAGAPVPPGAGCGCAA